jgi:SAM-dependent methyltransferase
MTELSSKGAVSPTVEYGNWVSKRLVYVPAVAGAGFLALSVLVLAFVIPAAVSIAVAGYLAYARYLFGPRGGDVQGAIWSDLVSRLEWDGRGQALDIGCGSGALSIRLALKYPEASITGVDRWGGQWEYSKSLCERNAAIEGVGARVAFRQAGASSLPFPDGSFDAVVSNLTFHEVKDAPDKRQLVREALRVLKKGGRFAIQDLFLLKHTYGDIDDLIETIKGWGVSRVDFVETRNSQHIPRALKPPFMVGAMGLILGEK